MELFYKQKKKINKIKKYGFKTIRFQVTYLNFTLENKIINSEQMEGIKYIIDQLLNLIYIVY